MLDILRKNSRHWLVVGLMAIVVVGLTAFFGYSARDTAGGQAYAAKVGADTIKMGEYITRYRNVVEMYRKRLGPDFSEKLLEPLNIKFQILSGMVVDRITYQEAKNNGLDVSKDELRDSIANVPYFQKDGKFSMDYYKGMLSYNRMTANEFENIQRREMLREKMKGIIAGSSKVSEDELKEAYKVNNQKIKVSYILVNEPADAVSIQVKDDEVKGFLASEEGRKETQDYYTKHNASFVDAKKKDKSVVKFEDVKQDIAKMILSRKKEGQAVDARIEQALKSTDIKKAATELKAKVETSTPFSRKDNSIPQLFGSNTNDVLWMFGLNGSKLYKREMGGKVYIITAIGGEKTKSEIPAKDHDSFRNNYLGERGNAEFMAYLDGLKKKWSKKVTYSPVLLKDIRQGAEE